MQSFRSPEGPNQQAQGTRPHMTAIEHLSQKETKGIPGPSGQEIKRKTNSNITNLNRYSPIDKSVEEKSKSGDCECESW